MKVLLVLLLMAPFLKAQAQEPEKAKVTLIKEVRVFDGSNILESQDVLIKEGKIISVTPSSGLPATDQAMNVEGRGKTLLPGFIDAHTHIVGEDLRLPPRFGVTTVLDMFMSREWMAHLKNEQRLGRASQVADLLSSGICATAAGGHGTEYGMNIPTIDKPEEADRFVAERVKEGSDYLKIIYDDAKTYGLNWPTLNKETLKALIAAAHKRNKMAVVHVWALWQAVDAVDAGADGLAHLFADQLPSPEFAQKMAQKGVFVIPTMTILESAHRDWGGKKIIGDLRIGPFLEESEKTRLLSTLPRLPGATTQYSLAEKALQILYKAGVKILAGTDAPNYGTAHGASLHRELELLQKAGLKPIDVLKSATSLSAKTFGLGDRGVLEPGKRADLILVNGNPFEDVDQTKNIAGVWKAGIRLR